MRSAECLYPLSLYIYIEREGEGERERERGGGRGRGGEGGGGREGDVIILYYSWGSFGSLLVLILN